METAWCCDARRCPQAGLAGSFFGLGASLKLRPVPSQHGVWKWEAELPVSETAPNERTVEPGLPEGACLVLVATPIGNLGDISARAIAVLHCVDVIACEDTRHTRKLLSALHITGKRLIAVHDHNEPAAAAGVVGLLAQGLRVAMVTDAGTPGVSDPGTVVVEAVIAAGQMVFAIPGPAAFVHAVTISGLPTDRFVMDGFLPAKGRDRAERLAEISARTITTVLYEAPHRIKHLMADLVETCGAERSVSVSRELTKRFEQTWRGPVGEAAAGLGEPRGEYVVVVGPAAVGPGAGGGSPDAATIDATIVEILEAGSSARDAADAVAARFGIARRQAYARANELRRR
jgi:16S rRNA (cytidine1402-2'-O)-methyltransferase